MSVTAEISLRDPPDDDAPPIKPMPLRARLGCWNGGFDTTLGFTRLNREGAKKGKLCERQSRICDPATGIPVEVFDYKILESNSMDFRYFHCRIESALGSGSLMQKYDCGVSEDFKEVITRACGESKNILMEQLIHKICPAILYQVINK